MKHTLLVCAFLICTAILFGCQSSSSEQHESNHSDTSEVKAPKVEIIANEHTDLNKKEMIIANVYYGEELVDDAEVTFEIKKGEENSEKIVAELTDTGTYTIHYTFSKNGTYQVTAHTNVKGYHTMPTINIQVGEGTEKTEENEEEHGEHEDHHEAMLTISNDELGNFKANDEELLTTSIKQGDHPLSDAKVRFEIWKDGEEHHQYIDAEEVTTKGTYTASHTFDEPGTYHITIHVEKEDIHDHVELSVEVE